MQNNKLEQLTNAILESSTDHSIQKLSQNNESIYTITTQIDHVFVGRSRESKICLIFPSTKMARGSIRTEGFTARVIENVTFEFEGRKWESNCFILECEREIFKKAFTLICEEVYTATLGKSIDEQSQIAKSKLTDWMHYFKGIRAMSAEEQLGLWGELWFVANSPNVAKWQKSWHGPSGSVFDFSLEDEQFEVKSSFVMLRHEFSLNQTTPLHTNDKIFFASVHAKVDDNGVGLDELIEIILSKVDDRAGFAKKIPVQLLSNEKPDWLIRISLVHKPLIFRIGSIPRIREYDKGILSIRYQAVLDQKDVLSNDQLPNSLRWLAQHERTNHVFN